MCCWRSRRQDLRPPRPLPRRGGERPAPRSSCPKAAEGQMGGVLAAWVRRRRRRGRGRASSARRLPDAAAAPRRRRHRPLVPRLQPELAPHRLDAKEQVRQLLAVAPDLGPVHHAPERVAPHAAPAQREAAPFEAQDVRRVVDDDFPELRALDADAQRVDLRPGQLAARPRARLAQVVRRAQLPPDLGAGRRRRAVAVAHPRVEALVRACDVREALAITQLEELEAAVVVENEVPGGHRWQRVVGVLLAGRGRARAFGCAAR